MAGASTYNLKRVALLLAVNLLYASVSIATKFTSQQEFLSGRYCLGLCGVVGILGCYAIVWQQILKRIELTTAYMFKGTSLIFVLFFSVLLFGEGITVWNIVGAVVIVTGIVLYARS